MWQKVTSCEQYIYNILPKKVRFFTQWHKLDKIALIVYPNQLPHLPDSMVFHNNYIITHNWSPRVQVGRLYEDLWWPPSLEHTVDTTTLFGCGWIFCLVAGTVFAAWPSNLACRDDVERPWMLNGIYSSPNASWSFLAKSQCVQALPGMSTWESLVITQQLTWFFIKAPRYALLGFL